MKKIKNNFGFTLAEMMVVIAITGILSSMALINFRTNEKQRQLRDSALLVTDGFKRLQSMALSGDMVGGAMPISYNFYLNPADCSQYILRAKLDEANYIAIGQTVKLINSNIKDCSNIGEVEIYPPRANMEFLNFPSYDEISLVVEYNGDGSSARTVKINKVSGRVDLGAQMANP
ncbi:MAG: type II secretion system protein [bacterium]